MTHSNVNVIKFCIYTQNYFNQLIIEYLSIDRQYIFFLFVSAFFGGARGLYLLILVYFLHGRYFCELNRNDDWMSTLAFCCFYILYCIYEHVYMYIHTFIFFKWGNKRYSNDCIIIPIPTLQLQRSIFKFLFGESTYVYEYLYVTTIIISYLARRRLRLRLRRCINS